MILWYDKNLPVKAPVALPLGRLLTPGIIQSAIFRSSFQGKNDTIVSFILSDSYDGEDGKGSHFGSFKIFKGEYLVTESKRSPLKGVAFGHSNLAFFDTSSREKTGYDNPVWPFYSAVHSHKEMINRFPKNVCGTIKGFTSKQEYDYLSFQNAESYYPEELVKEWSTQVLFLRKGILIRFDRAETSSKEIHPRFMMNFKSPRPEVNGGMIRSLISGMVEDFNGDSVKFTGHQKKGRITLHSLLPVKKYIRIVSGNMGDLPSKNLIKGRFRIVHPPTRKETITYPIKCKIKLPAGIMNPIPAMYVHPADSRKAGNFLIRIRENQSIRIIQTAALIAETIRFSHFPKLIDLKNRFEELGFRTNITNFEHWVEGRTNYDPVIKDFYLKPAYDINGKSSNIFSAFHIQEVRQSGHLEIRIPDENKKTRHYFLNVIQIQDEKSGLPSITSMRIEEDEGEIKLILIEGGDKYEITFSKTGSLNGKIKIEKENGEIKEENLIETLDFSNQPYGSRFKK